MRVLITGGAGFIGHHTVEHFLKNTDWEIIVLEGFNYAGVIRKITDISVYDPRRVRFVYHDIRSPISEFIKKQIGKIDYIIHMAAETHVDRSLEDPYRFVSTNVIGTFNMLEFAKVHEGLQKYIQISTDEVYGPAPKGKDFKEWERLKPSNPYSATKAGADCLAYSYSKCYKMPIIITRTMNNFGERHPEKFIPMVVRNLLLNKPIVIHGIPPNISSRKWLHARNHADALLFLLKNGTIGDIYNIAGDEMDVETLAKKIALIMGKRPVFKYLDFHSTRPGHDLRYSLDDSKIRKIGWKPPFSFERSLKKTIKWMVKNKEWLEI